MNLSGTKQSLNRSEPNGARCGLPFKGVQKPRADSAVPDAAPGASQRGGFKVECQHQCQLAQRILSQPFIERHRSIALGDGPTSGAFPC